MEDKEYLNLLPLTRTWLEDIVHSLLKRPNGTGEVDAIVLAVKHNGRDIGDNPESTITRTINNYCINAADLERNAKYPIFERVAPGTYRLIDYPKIPDLIEIQKIQFAEPGYMAAWKRFVKEVKKKPKWSTLTKKEKLGAFARNIHNVHGLQEIIQIYGGSVENFKPIHELKKKA